MKRFWYYFKWFVRRANRKVRVKMHLQIKPTKRCYGRRFSNIETTQERISKLIMSGKPFLAGRCGGIEALVCNESLKVKKSPKNNFSRKIISKAHLNAGFINPTREKLLEFSSTYECCVKECDVLGSMTNNREDYLITSFLPKESLITDIGNLEPYYSSNPWTKSLRGKKVLVINPFAESIKKQYYSNRTKLFPSSDILPDFELDALKAVQSIAGNECGFDDWFKALDYMFEEAMKRDFDVAIIGCGAYGFPLGLKIKQAGKQAIHLGGATQILFGVWGSRWDSIAEVKKFKNDFWISPSEDEKPKNFNQVENGCYW